MELWQTLHGQAVSQVAAAVADVLLVAYAIYRVLLLIRGTRAVSVLAGLFLLVAVDLVARLLGLSTLDWLVGSFLTYGLAFGLVVVFQDEIRRGLARLGNNRLFGRLDRAAGMDAIDDVVRAAEAMAARRIGALIVLERTADLADYADTGVRIDARLSRELLESVFQPGGTLHDGAAIVAGNRLVAARCILPSAWRPSERQLGTRHLAALGLSEEVDAPAVVVSEERGEMALAVGGRLHRPLDGTSLRRFLHRLFAPPPRAGTSFWRPRKRPASIPPEPAPSPAGAPAASAPAPAASVPAPAASVPAPAASVQ